MFTAICFIVAIYVAYRVGFSIGYTLGLDDGFQDGRKNGFVFSGGYMYNLRDRALVAALEDLEQALKKSDNDTH